MLAVSCGGAGGGGGEQRSPDQPGILLEDDFSDASTGWLGGDETSFVGENTDQEIADGVFRITVKSPEGRGGPDSTDLAVANASELEALGDVALEVDATAVQTVEGSFYALLCRLRDFDNFYGFAVVEDGGLSIFKIERGVTTELASAPHAVDLATTHRVRAACTGDRLSLTVDGAQTVQATDGSFDSGAIGFLAETRGVAGLTVEFDNLVVQGLGAAG